MFAHGESGRKSTTIHVLMVNCMCGHGQATRVGVRDKFPYMRLNIILDVPWRVFCDKMNI